MSHWKCTEKSNIFHIYISYTHTHTEVKSLSVQYPVAMPTAPTARRDGSEGLGSGVGWDGVGWDGGSYQRC